MGYPRSIRLSAEIMHDVGAYQLSDRAFRVWIYLRCADVFYDGRFPDDEELAWYCRTKPRAFAKSVAEMIAAELVERRHDGVLALITRSYEKSRVSGKEWAEVRAQVFMRDNYTCTYCGERGGKLECDHIRPFSRGGSDEPENLTTACFACNRSKRDKTLEEWRGHDGAHQVN